VLRRAEAGERIVVTVDGRPVAQLGPLEAHRRSPIDDLITAGLARPPDAPIVPTAPTRSTRRSTPAPARCSTSCGRLTDDPRHRRVGPGQALPARAGRDLVLEAMAADPVWCASAMARTEAMVALHRVATGRHQQRQLWAALREDWDAFVVVPVDEQCLARATEIGAAFGVRSVDAIHLAAADRLPRPRATSPSTASRSPRPRPRPRGRLPPRPLTCPQPPLPTLYSGSVPTPPLLRRRNRAHGRATLAVRGSRDHGCVGDVGSWGSMSGTLSDMSDTLHWSDERAEIHKVVVGPMDNNVFVLRCKETGDAVLLDAANEHELLLDLCQKLNVRTVLETHGHWDHIQAVPAVRDAGYEVGVTAEDAAMLDSYDYILEPDTQIEVGGSASRRSSPRATRPDRCASSSSTRRCCSRATPCSPAGPATPASPAATSTPSSDRSTRSCSPPRRRHRRHARPRRRHHDRRRAAPPPGVGRPWLVRVTTSTGAALPADERPDRPHPDPHRRPAGHADPRPQHPRRRPGSRHPRSCCGSATTSANRDHLQAALGDWLLWRAGPASQGRRPLPGVHADDLTAPTVPALPRRHRRGHRTERPVPHPLPDLEGRPPRPRLGRRPLRRASPRHRAGDPGFDRDPQGRRPHRAPARSTPSWARTGRASPPSPTPCSAAPTTRSPAARSASRATTSPSGTRRAGQGRHLPRLPVPPGDRRGLGHQLPAPGPVGPQGHRPVGLELRLSIMEWMERLDMDPSLRRPLPQRGVLRGREEAQRDPPDGHPRARDGHPRRDRLGPRHRRPAGRRHRRPGGAGDRPELGVLAITHYQRCSTTSSPTVVHILIDGRIVESGRPELARRLEAEGYEAWR
jgi:antitoxin (DNA-binding transcriptional repressor) of toxin-antitoxin stability system